VVDPASSGVFVDTGYLIALEDADDDNHPAATRHREDLTRMPPLMTTSYVVVEVVTFFNVHGQHDKAVELGEALLSSPSVARQDKRYSLTDCVSFVVMRNLGITTAFAFDRYFEQEGFVMEPLTP